MAWMEILRSSWQIATDHWWRRWLRSMLAPRTNRFAVVGRLGASADARRVPGVTPSALRNPSTSMTARTLVSVGRRRRRSWKAPSAARDAWVRQERASSATICARGSFMTLLLREGSNPMSRGTGRWSFGVPWRDEAILRSRAYRRMALPRTAYRPVAGL